MADIDHKKPRYVNTGGVRGPRDLPSAPPFLFREVTYRVFPLKANMARLTDFCDKYLNMDIPASICHFRPALPYVYMMVLNYGSMSAASVRAQNVGWVAQREVTFTVPLEWWREENGRMVFKDWACVSPFIFVDDDMSVATGREIYGWSKIKATVDHLDAPLWLEDPRAPTRLFRLRVPVLSRLYAGAKEEPRDLLLIDRDPPPSFAVFPPDLKNPFGPLAVVPNALRSWLGLAGEAVDMLTELPIRGYRMSAEGYKPRRDLRTYGAMAKKGAGMMARLLPDVLWQGRTKQLIDGDFPDESEATRFAEIFLNTITLKQFRDAEDPSQACYQALINSRMGYNRLNRSGLLGDLNLLRGDPSGGFNIRIAQYAAQPLVESLGLEVERVENGVDAPLAVLKPTFPFWGDVDLYYGKGEVICSRSPCPHGSDACTVWHPESEEKAPQPAAAPVPAPAAAPCHAGSGHAPGPAESARPVPRIDFNTITGAATQSIAGPFHFPDITVQVYPLLADPAKLREFLDHYLNDSLATTELGYEPFGGYVYLMVNVFGDGNNDGVMWSEANNIGWWADKSVQFAVPVKCYRQTPAGKVLDGIALVAPYNFGNSGRAVISDREVNGRPTVKASIETHPDVWLDEAGPVAERRMLRLDTEVFPALNVGQKSVVKTLLELDQRPPVPHGDETGGRLVAERWREPLVADLKRKALFARDHAKDLGNVGALALEVLAEEAPIHWLHLKQYRDAFDTDAACYQALVRMTRTITRIYEIREIEPKVFVRLHQIPDHPIAETLGLKSMHVVSNSEGVVRVMQPIRPFWMRLGIKEDLGKALCWRTDNGPWHSSRPARPAAESIHRAHFGPGVLAPLGKATQGLRETARHWLRGTLVQEANALVETVIPALPSEIKDRLRAEISGSHCCHGEPKAERTAKEILGLSLDGPGAGSTSARIAVLFGSRPAEEGYRVMEAVAGLLEKHGVPLPSERLSYSAARESLGRMEDLQTAIEALLAHAQDDRAEEPAPVFRIPKDAFPEGIDINGGSGGDEPTLVPVGQWYCLGQPPAKPSPSARKR